MWRSYRRWAPDMVAAGDVVVHLVAAPIFAYGVSIFHKVTFPGFDPLQRAEVMTATVLALDLFVVAPLLEHSFAMFRSPIGTWIPLAAIFLVGWLA